MATTKIEDVIQPELFTDYVIDKTTEKSQIMFSGAIENNPKLNQLVTGGGTILTMPKWNDLSGDSEVLSDQRALTPDKITATSELATLLQRGKSWSTNELAGDLAGDDPMQAIGSRTADWWVRDEKKIVLSILKGIFNATDRTSGGKTYYGLSDLIYNHPEANISGAAVLDAKQLMGDAADMLTTMYMHSAVFTELQKQNVIQFIPVAESKIAIPTYLGYRVVFDDSAPYRPAEKGIYEVTLGGTYATSDTVTIGGVTYTVLATDTSLSILAASVKAALAADATFGAAFDVDSTGAKITITQKVKGTGDKPSVSKSSTAGTVAIETITEGLAKPIYTTYLLSRGCIQRGIGKSVSQTPTETARDELAGVDYLINRQSKVLHPRGVSWVGSGSIVDPTPNNIELATGDYWSRVADIKKIGVVQMLHTLGS